VQVDRSDGVRELLPLDALSVDPEGPVYGYVRGGALLARFDRGAAFAVLDGVSLDAAGRCALQVGARSFALHTLAPGAVPPYVHPVAAEAVPSAG
jgi:hypothetical protein